MKIDDNPHIDEVAFLQTVFGYSMSVVLYVRLEIQ